MAFILDTNVAIKVRDGDDETVRAVTALQGAVMLSVITRVELESGVHKYPKNAVARRARLDTILAAMPCLVFDEEAAAQYGRIVAVAGYSRRKLLDRMIAAQALIHRATLITLNADDFLDVPGLQLLAW